MVAHVCHTKTLSKQPYIHACSFLNENIFFLKKWSLIFDLYISFIFYEKESFFYLVLIYVFFKIFYCLNKN